MTELEEDEILLDSVMFRFIQISENSRMLSEDYLDKTKELPWKKLKAMRNRIVHAYSIVRLDIVYNTIKKDLPIFRTQTTKSMRQ